MVFVAVFMSALNGWDAGEAARTVNGWRGWIAKRKLCPPLPALQPLACLGFEFETGILGDAASGLGEGFAEHGEDEFQVGHVVPEVFLGVGKLAGSYETGCLRLVSSMSFRGRGLEGGSYDC